MEELNLIIDPSHFHQVSLQTNGGMIEVSKRSLQFPLSLIPFKSVGWWKYETQTFDANKLGHLLCEKYNANKLFSLFNSNKDFVSFGQMLEDNDDSNGDYTHVELKTSKENSIRLQAYVESYTPLYKKDDSFVHEQNIRVPARRKEFLWCNNQYVVYTRRAKGKDINIVAVPIISAIFFNVHKGKSSTSKFINWLLELLKLTGKIYFGGYEQIYINYKNQETTDHLKQYLINYGAHFSMDRPDCELHQGHFRFVHIFQPSMWMVKERIGFTENAILYERVSPNWTDELFLPYEMCYVVMHTSGLIRRRLAVYGLMNVVTKQSFDKEVINRMIEEAKSHGLDANANGLVMRSTYLWWQWLALIFTLGFHRNARVVEGENIFLFTKGARGHVYSGTGHESKLTGSISGRTKVLPKACTSFTYTREHWYNIFGKLEVDCVTSSIRDDQKESASVHIELEKVGYCNGKKWTNRYGGERIIEKS